MAVGRVSESPPRSRATWRGGPLTAPSRPADRSLKGDDFVRLATSKSPAGAASRHIRPLFGFCLRLLPLGLTEMEYSLHPLVLIQISDHITRLKAQGAQQRVVGAVLGVQSSRTVEITNAFELKYSLQNWTSGQLIIDKEFLLMKQEQCAALDSLLWTWQLWQTSLSAFLPQTRRCSRSMRLSGGILAARGCSRGTSLYTRR